MPLSDRQATTYSGDKITVDGLTYVWNGSQYIVEDIIRSTNRTVTVPFFGILSTAASTTQVNLLGNELDIYVDGVLWNGAEVQKTRNQLIVTFAETYILQQRLITFKTPKGECVSKFVIKAKVNSEDDVVIVQFGLREETPTIGDYSAPVVNQYIDYSGYGGGGGRTPSYTTYDIGTFNPDLVQGSLSDYTDNIK